jgi:PAS domain S-box-containing protein
MCAHVISTPDRPPEGRRQLDPPEAAPRPDVDRIVRLAADLLGTPMAAFARTTGSGLLVSTEQSRDGLLSDGRSMRIEPPLGRALLSAQPTPSARPNGSGNGSANGSGNGEHAPAAAADPFRALGIHALLGVPVRSGGGLLGRLCVMDRAARHWSARDLRLLQTVGTFLEAALDAAAEPRRGGPPAGVGILHGHRLVAANARLSSSLGLDGEAAERGPDLLERVPPEHRQEVRARLTGSKAAPRADEEEGPRAFRVAADDGTSRELEAFPVTARFRGRSLELQVLLDVTGGRAGEVGHGRDPDQVGERFHLLFDRSSQHVALLSPAGEVVEINQTALAFGGSAREEIIGQPIWRAPWWTRSGRADEISAAVAKAAAGEAVHYETEVTGASGETAVLELSVRPLVDVTGRVTMIIKEGKDITGRKRVEEALARSEERFRLVARATTEVIWEWDLASGEVLWSEDAAKTFRYPPSEVQPRIEWWYERIHPEERERVFSGLEQATRASDDIWSYEYRLLRGDGTYAVILDRGLTIRDARGAPIRMVGSMMDVTERRRAELSQRFLAQASSLLNSSLQPRGAFAAIARLTIPVVADMCVIQLLEDGRIRTAASAHADPLKEGHLCTRDRAALAELNDRDPRNRAMQRRHPVLVARCTDALLQAMAGTDEELERLRELQIRSLMALPLTIAGELLGVILLGTSSSLRQYGPGDLLIGEDLARRVQLSLENARLYQQAREAIRAREDVLAMVSHDLRNPLNTILMTTQLLSEADRERRSEHRHFLEVIRRSADGMAHMIADLLDLASLEAGGFSVELETLSVDRIAENVRDAFTPLAEEKGLRFDCVVEPGLPVLAVDPGQILRVLSNLVGNAFKFAPDGGCVVLRVLRDEDAVRFEVTDSGPGIPADEQEHVFDRYWKSEQGDRRGAGLGLAIARGLVEAHGGTIGLQSREGAGSTFHFRIPVDAT